MARILTVSDQPDWRAVVLAALAEHHDVDAATDPGQARTLLRTGVAYDLAVVDLQRSTGGTAADGPDELIDLLWSRHPDTPRIIVAASRPASTPAATFARYGVRRRAEAVLHDLLAQRDRFTIDLYDVGMRIERTVTVRELLDSADALAEVEERHAEVGW